MDEGPTRKNMDEIISNYASNRTLCAARLSCCSSSGSPVTKGCCKKNVSKGQNDEAQSVYTWNHRKSTVYNPELVQTYL